MSNALHVLSSKMADRFGLGSEGDVLSVLKATAFKGPATDAQMTALLIVAQQYELNPFTKEIFAFPDKNNGIVPVVGVDGWARIINGNAQFDGMEFSQDEESCTCIIYRKDRGHPIKVTEYMSECKRGAGPWQSHPKRMLRHKAMIQCARLAFGFGGIYDQDEAERIAEKDMGAAEVVTERKQEQRPSIEPYPAASFAENLPKWKSLIDQGKKTADDIITMVSSKAILSDAQIAEIRKPAHINQDGVIDAEFTSAYEGAE